MSVCVCSYYIKWKVRKRQDFIWRRTVGNVYACLKYRLLQLPIVQGGIFGRSYSRHWCCCLRSVGCSIINWFDTISFKPLSNEIWQPCSILFIYLLMPKVPIFKMTSYRTDINFIFVFNITNITFNTNLIHNIFNQEISLYSVIYFIRVTTVTFLLSFFFELDTGLITLLL